MTHNYQVIFLSAREEILRNFSTKAFLLGMQEFI